MKLLLPLCAGMVPGFLLWTLPAAASVSWPSLNLHWTAVGQGELHLSGDDLGSFVIQRSQNLQDWEWLADLPATHSAVVPVSLAEPPVFFRLALPGPATELVLDLLLDPARAAAGPIDREGGVLEAVDAVGNRFRLTLPPEALLSPETITLTPIEGIANLPFTGFLAGVDLAPDGLRLLRPATLEIIPAAAFDPFLYSGFAYEGEGRNPHLLPIQRTETSLDFTLMRFSGFCAAEGTGEEIQSNLPPPRCTREWAYREISAIIDAAVRRALQDPDGEVDYTPEEEAAMNAVIETWYTGTILPWAEQALTNEAILRQATRELLEWDAVRHMLDLIEEDDSYTDTTAALLLAEGYLNAIDNAYDRCVSLGNPMETQLILGYAAEYQLAFDFDPHVADDAMEQVRRCVQFELTFHTQLLQDYSANNDVRNEVEFLAVGVKLVPDETLLILEGAGLLSYLHFHHHERDCHWDPDSWFTATAEREDSWIEARMTLGLNYTPSSPPPGDPDPCAFIPPLEPDENMLIHLYLELGEPREIVTWECYDGDGDLYNSGVFDFFPLGRTLFLWANFERYHQELGDFHYIIDNITPGQVVFAEKHVDRVLEVFSAPLHEETVLTLHHTPAAD